MTALETIGKYSKTFFRPQGKLIATIAGDYLWLTLFRAGKFERTQKFLLREAEPDILREQITAFGGGGNFETILVLSRSEILQKPVRLEKSSESPVLMKQLESWLESHFPFRADEMVYGFMPNNAASLVHEGALLMALPETRLMAILGLLNGLNIRPIEIVSEDQLLVWTACERYPGKDVLCLDQNAERLLAVYVSGGTMKFSRSLVRSADTFSMNEVFQEVSLNLIESGGRCEILLYAGLNDNELGSVRNYFNARIEQLLPGEIPADVPPLLCGIQYYGRYDRVSLLPRASKLEKYRREKKQEWEKTGLSFLVFTASLVLGYALILFLLQGSTARLEMKASQSDAGYAAVRRLQSEITAAEQAAKSKQVVLELLCLLSEKMPAGTKFRELSLLDNRFTLRAEAVSHGIMAAAVQSLEKINTLTQVKLETSRLRKRIDEDFYEFEVSAKWQI